MSAPTSHLFDVSITIKDWQADRLDVKLPVWTPGSYLVREYAKHLQDFQANRADGQSLAWQKCTKNHWQVETRNTTDIILTYRVYAHELTVRTNHLNASHGYFNPGALLMYVPGLEQAPSTLSLTPPQGWTVTTALPTVPGQAHTFAVDNYDTLVDSPVEMGTHAVYDFEVRGIPHQWAIWGNGNFDIEKLIADTQKIVEVEADLFGGLPYDRYLFLLHLSANGYGGLEHKFSTSLLFPRFNFQKADQYHRFISLVAHEFFHLWNVKRIRPKALEAFDYDQENYTDALWFCEGVTSFYDLMIPLWAGIYGAKTYLQRVAESINRLKVVPGQRVQSLSESSFDTWIKLYRPHENAKNAQVSYYLKGELVSLLLDLRIRQGSDGVRSLNDVMRQLWYDFGKDEVGYTQAELRQTIETVAEQDLSDFWENYIDGTADLPYDEYLQPFGLTVQPQLGDSVMPYLGIEWENKSIAKVKFVAMDSPAQQAGLCPGDELLAINGYKVTAGQLAGRLEHYQPGDSVEITLFHDEQLVTTTATLMPAKPTSFQIQPVPSPTENQIKLYKAWLKANLKDLG